MCQFDCVGFERLRWSLGLPVRIRAWHCQGVVLGTGRDWGLTEAVVGVYWNGFLLLQGLLERVVGRDALVDVLVVGDDAVDDGWLLEGREDVVEVGAASDLSVLRGLPVRREGRQLLRVGSGEDIIVVHVVLERQRGLLGHQTVDPIVLRLRRDFVVVT